MACSCVFFILAVVILPTFHAISLSEDANWARGFAPAR